MTDIASLGVKVESNLKTLNKDMEKTIDLSEKVTDATNKINESFKSNVVEASKIIEAEKKKASAIDKIISSIKMQNIAFIDGKEGLVDYKLSLLGASEAEKKFAQDILASMEMVRSARKSETEQVKSNLSNFKSALSEQAKVSQMAEDSEKSRLNSINSIIESLSREEKNLTMTKEEQIKYNLALLGASEAEKKSAQDIQNRINAIKDSEKAQKDAIEKEKEAAKIASKLAKEQAQEQKQIADAETKRKDSINGIILKLRDEAATVGKSKAELTQYQLTLLGASEAEKKEAAALQARIKAMQDANSAAKKHDSVLGSLISRLSALGAAYFGLQAIKEFTKDVVLLSARYETLGVVVENVGKTAGYSTLEIDEQSKALQKQGISMIQSRESITKLIQAHIDLSNAQKLARIAQDAAVIGNVNSSHALERIVYGIQTAQIEVLKSVGLNVNFENSYKKLSIQLGKSTTDLTESEKTQARLNVVLERGADIAGTYESAMTTAGKQITSFTRYLEDYKVIFGQAFNDATTKVIADATKWMKELTEVTGSSETQTGLKQFADGLGTILSVMLQLAKVGAEIIKYIGVIGNLSENLSIEQKGIELVNKGLIDQVKYTKANWEEKKKLIAEAEPITKITKKIGEQTEGYNLYSESVKKSSKALRDAKKEEQDLLDKSLLDQKKAQSEAEKAADKAASYEKARQGRVDAIINKMKEQIATYKQATEVSAEYQLKQEGASPAEIKLAKDLANTIDALKAKTKAQEAYKKVMDKTAPDPIEMNRQKSIEAVNQAVKDGAVLNGTYAESLEQINKHFDDLDLKDFKSGLKELETEINSMKTASFGNEMADGINNAVISMRDLNDYLSKQTHIQAELNKKKEEANKLSNDEERKKALKEIDDLEDKNISNQLTGYRELFGTTSQLFKENSREREVMHNIEMAFAAAEIAMNLEKTISAAYLAIMGQGTGDPYSAFARIAAMTALAGGIVAAAGGSLSGGGSGSAPTAVSGASQSTALGLTEQSQSIANAFSFLEDIESGQYNELKDISSSMKDLNKNITGLVTSIVRTGGISEFKGVAGVSGGTSFSQDMLTKYANPFGGAGAVFTDFYAGVYDKIPIIGDLLGGVSNFVDDLTSSISNAIFGGSKKTSVLASGLQITPGTIGSGEVSTQAYADIKVTKSGGLFGSDKTYFKTLTDEVDQSVQDMVSLVFKNMGETMVDIAKGLGTENLEEVFNYVFDIGKIDLTGLDTEGINKALQEAFSTASDKAATDLFGELIGRYQKIGEGILETAVRLVGEKAVIMDVLEMTNQGFEGSDIPAKALEVTQSLIGVAGGLDNLTDAASTYYDKFFTDEEKQIRLQGQLSETMASMGQSMPTTRDELRKIVEGLDLTTEAGQRGYVTLLGLSESFDSVFSKIEAENEKRLELELQIMNLTGKGAEALAIQRQKEIDSLSEANKPLQQRIYDLQDESAALEAAKKEADERTAALKIEADAIKAINEKKFDLEIQILKLTGKESEALILQRQKEIDSLDEINKPLQERIYALTDEAKAIEKINTINAQRKTLEIELLNATGKTAEATAMSRQIELASMDESLRSLKLQIWAANDLAEANELAIKSEQERINAIKEASDTAKQIAQEQLESAKSMLKGAVDAEIEFLTDLENKAKENLQIVAELLQRSFEDEKNKIIYEHANLIEGLTKRLDEAKTSASDLEGVFNSLSSARKSMFVAGSETDQYKEIQKELFKTLQDAIRGDFSGVNSISEKVGGLSGNNQSMFTTEEEYKRDFFKTYRALSELEELTGTQLTEQQQIVKNLETQIEIADVNNKLTLESLQDQYDAVLGVDKSVISFADAVVRYQKAQYEANGANALLKAQTIILTNQMNALLGINNSVLSVNEAINRLVFAQAAVAASEVPAFAAGGYHSGGPMLVGERGPEVINAPPAMITSNNDLKSIMSNEEVVAELKAMRTELARANFELVKNSGESKKTLREWQEIGILTRTA